MEMKTVEKSPFSGFQVTQQAADSLRHLVTESKWRKLQKHFSISLCFTCCRCDLLLFDLDLLYDHFSTVHQVDLSYIKSLLKETEEGTAEVQTSTFRLSENLIEDLIQLNKSTSLESSFDEDISDHITRDDDKIKRNQDLSSDKTGKLDILRRKGRPRKRSSQDKRNESNNVKATSNENPVVLVSKRTRKGGKKDVITDSTKVIDNNQNVKCRQSSLRSRSAGKNLANAIEKKGSDAEKDSDEVACDEDNIPVDLSELVNEVIHASNPTLEETHKSTKRTVGRNMDSEEIKAKTCAICKEIQQSIKDCFRHYETVHDYVPKSFYEKPPVDTKFEKNKARNDKRSKGRSKTDVNAEQCKFCGKMFLKDNIDKHIHLRHYWLRIERKEKRRQNVVCHLCGKLYHHKQNLEAHMAAVHRGKPRRKSPKLLTTPQVHICQTCGYTTPEIRRLKNHIAAHHEGVMPYQCDQCSFKTWEPSSWRCHKQRHCTEKKYKCTDCSYQCIQRKQLRRHMSVKHQKTLPKKWKRRDDAAVMNPHSNKFLQKDPDFIAVKQKQIQINRQQPAKLAKDKDTDTMQFQEANAAAVAVTPGDGQYEVSNNSQDGVQLIQLAPTVEILSLKQSEFGSLSGDVIPTEVVITVANTVPDISYKSLTSVASSNNMVPPAFRIEKVNQVTEDIRRFLTIPPSTQLSRQGPVIIPPSEPSVKALDEPSMTSQQVVMIAAEEDQMIQPTTTTKRRYYRPHFSQLHDVIQHRADGPVLQKGKDGTVIWYTEPSTGTSSTIDPYESREAGDTCVVPPVDTTFQLDNSHNNVIGQVVDGQQVVFLDATTEHVVDVYSGNTDRVTGNNSSISTIDVGQASELTDLLPASIHNQISQGKPVAATSSDGKTIQNSGAIDSGSVESESMTSLEQDIAQTLIQINPLSRFHGSQSDKKS